MTKTCDITPYRDLKCIDKNIWYNTVQRRAMTKTCDITPYRDLKCNDKKRMIYDSCNDSADEWSALGDALVFIDVFLPHFIIFDM